MFIHINIQIVNVFISRTKPVVEIVLKLIEEWENHELEEKEKQKLELEE